MFQMPASPSFVSRFVGSERREQERLLAEQEGQAGIARLVAMFEVPIAPYALPERSAADAAETTVTGFSPRREIVSYTRATVAPNLRACPDCLEMVQKTAYFCPYCSYDFDGAASAWPDTTMAAAV
jgi:hypothetical protein